MNIYYTENGFYYNRSLQNMQEGRKEQRRRTAYLYHASVGRP